MASNRKSSDDLHRLIHSLSTEEKGFFVKFARRQVARGGHHLELFNAISQQDKFNPAGLKEKFRHYATMKVYLKEMILDSLILYHRKYHPHIGLFNQIEKTHVMVMKGQGHEALKVLEKALEQSNKMELFALTCYLLGLRFELGKQSFATSLELRSESARYGATLKEMLVKYENLMESQMQNEEWFLAFNDPRFHPSQEFLTDKKGLVGAMPSLSLRAEIKKVSSLVWLHLLGEDMEAAYNSGKELIKLERKLKGQRDASFNIVPAISNYVINSVAIKKFEEAEKLNAVLLRQKTRDKFQDDIAFVRATLSNLQIYFHTGRFAKAEQEIRKSETALLQAFRRTNDKSKPRFFYSLKMLFLFLGGKYAECWLCIHEHFLQMTRNEQFFPHLLILQMMIQLELSNYGLLKGMAQKAERKLKQKNLNRPLYDELIRFFKNVTSYNLRQQAVETLGGVKRTQSQNKFPVLLFNAMPFEYWLESKITGFTIENQVKAALKKRSNR